MRKILLLLAVVSLCVSAYAQDQDPTGKNRYLIVAPPRYYRGAQVLRELPQGATKCHPATELFNPDDPVTLINSLGHDRADLIQLTELGEIANYRKQIFLCGCGDGTRFNELFLPPQASEREAPVPQPTAQPATPINVNVSVVNELPPREEPEPAFTPEPDDERSIFARHPVATGVTATLVVAAGKVAWHNRHWIWCWWHGYK